VNHTWSCDDCGFETHAPNRDALLTRVKRHLAGNGGNVLLYDPPNDRATGDCVDLLLPYDLERTAVLYVTRDPHAHLGDWVDGGRGWPKRVGIVTPGSPPLTGGGVTEDDVDSAPLTVRRVENPSLQELGITTSEELRRFDDVDAGVVVCFDSLSALLSNFEVPEVFNFVKLLSTRIQRVEALAHFHMTPSQHVGSTKNVLEELFDMVIDATEAESAVRLP
jgi:hypothetical protein